MGGKMLKVSGVLAMISIWLILLLLGPSIAASDLSFDVGSSPTKAMYSKLLSNIRDNVKDPKLKYGGTDIPVMAEESPKTTKLLLVDLKASEGGTITIGINKVSLYVEGYLDKIKINNKEVFRAHIFPDASSYAIKNLFPEAPPGDVNRVEMKYTSGYGDIQNKAGLRSKVGLGIPQLNKFINKVYGKPLDVRTEAQLMLIVIQMLPEATRFKYIENMILENFYSFGYKPDPKTLSLEQNWQTITRGIQNSKNGVISPVLHLEDDTNKPWIVSKVSEIAPDMGLLKNEGQGGIDKLAIISVYPVE